jgi:hypothetical protein
MAKIEVKDIKEHKNGSATLYLEYDGDFEDLIKKRLNVEKVSKKMIKDELMQGLLNYIDLKEKQSTKKTKKTSKK